MSRLRQFFASVLIRLRSNWPREFLTSSLKSWRVEALVVYSRGYPGLVFDCCAGIFAANKKPRRRLACLGLLVLLVAPPLAPIVFGTKNVGSGWAFALALLIWPILVEWPGWSVRNNGQLLVTAPVLGWRLWSVVVVSLVVFVSPLFLPPLSLRPGLFPPIARGFYLGALIAATIHVFQVLVSFLVKTDGSPIYDSPQISEDLRRS